jgi:hypothetical protein
LKFTASRFLAEIIACDFGNNPFYMFTDETNMKTTHMQSDIQQNESNKILRLYYVMRNVVIEASGYISTKYLFCSDQKLSYGDVL